MAGRVVSRRKTKETSKQCAHSGSAATRGGSWPTVFVFPQQFSTGVPASLRYLWLGHISVHSGPDRSCPVVGKAAHTQPLAEQRVKTCHDHEVPRRDACHLPMGLAPGGGIETASRPGSRAPRATPTKRFLRLRHQRTRLLHRHAAWHGTTSALTGLSGSASVVNGRLHPPHDRRGF